jgi:hypothetical protein
MKFQMMKGFLVFSSMMSSPPQNRSYSYRPLSVVRNEIRLLLLKPGGSYDRLSCILRHVSLDDNPKYTALSYAWGNPDITCPISLDSFALMSPPI